MARTAAGKGRCAMCGEPITWRKNDSGTMSYFCQDCDFQGYAKIGTLAARLAAEEIGKVAALKSPPETPATAKTAPAAHKAAGLLMG